ncbi:MAG TPA: hypothetical protein VKF17_07505, partial [Isosphaeraceae bacterium]|nr:hypothetical protein [Isosphaeraceae bacterium]
MSRTARLWKGAGLLTLGGVLLSGVVALGDDGPPLVSQLNDLGRQALAQGATAMAQTFFQKALALDPGNADATRGLKDTKEAQDRVVRVAFQDPATAQPPAASTTPPPAPGVTAPAAGVPAPAGNGQPVPGIPIVPAPAGNGQPIPGIPIVPAPAAASANQPATSAGPHATLEESEREDNVARQRLTSDVEQRLQAARSLVASGQPSAALTNLRLAQNYVRSATDIAESVRSALDKRIQAQILTTVRDEERIVAERAEQQRLLAASEQRSRAVSEFMTNQETIKAMMTQFALLMDEGVYNVMYGGGYGNITAAAAPFYSARVLAQHARALMRRGTLPYSDWDPAPYAGMFTSMTTAFLAQELQFRQLEWFRYMLTMQDVTRAGVPFPDNRYIEYPDAEVWRTLSERRIARYGKAVDLFERDAKTKSIQVKLDQPIAMSFPNETPLEDVLKYIKQATQGANDSGIPIYVDPLGLQEADKTMTSPVQIDLEGVPLKTTLRLLLKQLGLTYTVKDGFLMITSQESEDQQTEIRV